jgi:hypothetical protein
LLRAVGAALEFRVETDEESVRMAQLLGELSPAEFVKQVTGLGEGELLFADLTDVVGSAQDA